MESLLAKLSKLLKALVTLNQVCIWGFFAVKCPPELMCFDVGRTCSNLMNLVLYCMRSLIIIHQ